LKTEDKGLLTSPMLTY